MRISVFQYKNCIIGTKFRVSRLFCINLPAVPFVKKKIIHCSTFIIYRIHFVSYFIVSASEAPGYQPTWDSLDTRPLPHWYDAAKIGIFIHWGVYSVPAFGSEWFWINWMNGNPKHVDFMKKNFKPGFTYQEFASAFTAEFFDANEWAKLFERSGAK